jgi:hypothetical protein
MLNLVQHLTKLRTYETLKQVQGERFLRDHHPSFFLKNK